MFKFPKLNIPKQLFASNPFQRPNPTQPVNPMGVSGRSMMSAFGQPIARAPQPTSGVGGYSGPIPQSRAMTDSETAAHNAAFDKMRADVAALPKMPSFFGNVQPVARAPQPTQGPSAFAGMFGNGGFGQPLPPFTSAFGQPIARAPQPTQTPFLGGFGVGQIMPAQQTPQPTTGLSGLGSLSPEQINQLRNSIQTLPANINQELAKMSPGGMQQTAQNQPLFEQNPFANNLGYNDTSTQNMMAGPGMGFPAAPVPSGGATGGLSSLGSV
jgi:hypothetical protein